MAGLGLFLGLVTKLFGETAYAIADAKEMSKPVSNLKDGTPVYMNRKNQRFVNGEQLILKYDYDNDKFVHVGNRTGKVYIDPEEERRRKHEEEDRLNKQKAIERGDLAYLKWSDKFKMYLTCEISTGKIIAGLSNYKGKCRKTYAAPSESFCNISACGDYGEPITLEEFHKLDLVRGSHWRSVEL